MLKLFAIIVEKLNHNPYNLQHNVTVSAQGIIQTRASIQYV